MQFDPIYTCDPIRLFNIHSFHLNIWQTNQNLVGPVFWVTKRNERLQTKGCTSLEVGIQSNSLNSQISNFEIERS